MWLISDCITEQSKCMHVGTHPELEGEMYIWLEDLTVKLDVHLVNPVKLDFEF